MGLLDKYLLGKKGRADGVQPPQVPTNNDSDDALNLEAAYGLGGNVPATEPAIPPPNPSPSGVGAVAEPTSPPPAPVVGGTTYDVERPADPTDSVTPQVGDQELLDSGLRELFTENLSTLDPQLETLLGKVGKIEARDLAEGLRQLARSIGADSRPGTSGG